MKCKLNFWIDVAIYVLMGVMLFSGFLMNSRCPRDGRKLTLLGFDRHGWGVLHFWVAVALLVGVVLHLWLHWRGFAATTTKQYWLRAAIPVLAILLILALAALPAPFALKPAMCQRREGLQYRGGAETTDRAFAEQTCRSETTCSVNRCSRRPVRRRFGAFMHRRRRA